MPLPSPNQLHLLLVFYKSTLFLSITVSVLLAAVNWPSVLFPFGFCFFTAGTVISILYKEISCPQEYYFYYNKGIPKWWLMLICAGGNLIAGLLLIIISAYGKHP
jgi:hypothetical protein